MPIGAAKASELGDVPRRVSCGIVEQEMVLYQLLKARARVGVNLSSTNICYRFGSSEAGSQGHCAAMSP